MVKMYLTYVIKNLLLYLQVLFCYLNELYDYIFFIINVLAVEVNFV